MKTLKIPKLMITSENVTDLRKHYLAKKRLDSVHSETPGRQKKVQKSKIRPESSHHQPTRLHLKNTENHYTIDALA